MENWESGNGNGTGTGNRTSELKTGDVLRLSVTIVALVRLFILIRCIQFLIKACCSTGAKFISYEYDYSKEKLRTISEYLYQ